MGYFGILPLTKKATLDPMITRTGYGGPLVETAGTARTVYYTFETASSGYQNLRGTAAKPLTASQQAMVKSVMAKLAAAGDVKFVQGARYISPLHNQTDQYGYQDPATIMPTYDIAFHSYARGSGTGEALPDLQSKALNGGYIGNRVTVRDTAAKSSDALFFWMHETGHALGLKHPGNYSGGYGSGPYLPKGYDSTAYTVMSYNGSTKVKNYGSLDKAAISYIYGKAGSDHRITSGYKVTDTDFDDKYNARTLTHGVYYNGKAGHDLVYGTDHGDTLYGGAGDDRLYGYSGNDIMKGDAGYDMLDGGAGDDRLYGDSANTPDILRGGDGNDSLYGGGGGDSLEGGAGDDLIHGGAGADSIWGGSGNDTIISDESNQSYADTVYGGAGNDLITTYGGNDVIYGGDNAAGIGDGNDTIDAGDGADTIYGGEGNDLLMGGAGADSIEGGAGNDTLIGGTGSDTLIGGEGNDVIYVDAGDAMFSGGAGDDTFVFDVASLNAQGVYSTTTISEFEGAGVAGGDVLSLVNFTTVTDTSMHAITNAAQFAALGSHSGGNTTYDFYADGQYYSITLAGTLNANDIHFGTV